MKPKNDDGAQQPADDTVTPDPKTDNATGTTASKGGEEKGERLFTQDELEKELGVRLDRERRKAEKAAEDARKKAEEDALAKRQEFEQLASQRGERLAKLEPELDAVKAEREALQSRVQALEEAIQKDVDAELKSLNLSPSIVELLNGKDALERRTWLTAHRDELKKTRVQGAPPSPDPGRTDGKGPSEADKNAIARQYSRAF